MNFREYNIEHADVVISHFGYWPSFKDAEIISMAFVSNKEDGQAGVDMKILAFETTDKLKDGSLELAKHCLIDIEFIGLGESKIEGFGHQNVLAGLRFGKRDNLLCCELKLGHGVEGYIEARRIRIHKLTLGIGPHT